MKKSFLMLSLLGASSFSRANAQQVTTPNPNLAVGKKFVSSDPNTRNWDNGLTDNSWVSGRGTTFATNDSAAFPKMVTLDLETAQTLGYVALGVPPFGSTKTVSVALSLDGDTFTEVGKVVFPEAEEKKVTLDFKPVSARFVRLIYINNYAAKHNYNPRYAFTTELAVYAPGAPPVLPPTPKLPENAGELAPVGFVKAAAPKQPADEPAPKLGTDGLMDQRFSTMHQSFLERGKAGPIGVLFVGDSITDHWRRVDAKDSWDRFSRFNTANFGIGGDKTQHILWRFENGELDGIKPKVVVVLIGTNNMRLNSAAEITQADTKIVSEIHRRLPDAKVLLFGIFPRGEQATEPARTKIKEVNAQLAKLDDGNQTRFLDIGDKFLQADGSISKEVMADALHPTPKGYQIWADAMLPLLDEMMK